MAVRPIDGNDFMRRLTLDTSKGHYGEFTDGSEVAFTFREIAAFLEQTPTLTPPNEGVKDKNVPTNGPLTLEELRPMAEPTPVWWDWVQGWVLARKGMIISWNGVYYNFEEVKGNFYRRPPEGEEEP